MSEEPQVPLNQTTPLYHVPSAQLAAHKQPRHWLAWLGINCLAFFISSIIYPVLNLALIFSIGATNVQLPLINGQRALQPNLWVILIIPVFITILIASLLQSLAINHRFKRLFWSLNSATLGTLSFVGITYFILSKHEPTTLAGYIWAIFFIFGFTSSAISWLQWRGIRQLVDNAWQWALITTLSWTTLGSLIWGAGLGFWLRNLMRH
ncbi:hypothetical protein [Herpetosiphon giganteus]|uniref:hypothetical protein n=1 Tax=Herpetosiphon giganteus TaxID=2029754 RepID=UPI00195CD7B4|nr:hypothetical protein [Herpetosiphon giganteus]MBM7842425.1 hypothetical protein [Herpetosiphon giganteus]